MFFEVVLILDGLFAHLAGVQIGFALHGRLVPGMEENIINFQHHSSLFGIYLANKATKSQGAFSKALSANRRFPSP